MLKIFFLYFKDCRNANERESLLIKKIQQCTTLFDFLDPNIDNKSQLIKKNVLNELIDYITDDKNSISDNASSEIINMVIQILSCNDYINSVKSTKNLSKPRFINTLFRLRVGLIFK